MCNSGGLTLDTDGANGPPVYT